jgi:hypothetical protein
MEYILCYLYYFSQSKYCRFLVRWRGTDGKALLQPLAFAGSLCGLQMCLGVKGWVRGLALTYLFFCFTMLFCGYIYLNQSENCLNDSANLLDSGGSHLNDAGNYLNITACQLNDAGNCLNGMRTYLNDAGGYLNCNRS